MFAILISSMFCCDLSALEGQKDSALDRLKVGCTRFIQDTDKDYDKWKKTFQEMLDQKVIDTKTSESAAISQYILDFCYKNEKTLKSEPKEIKGDFITTFARHIALMAEKNYIFPNWRDYEQSIEKWAKYYLGEEK